MPQRLMVKSERTPAAFSDGTTTTSKKAKTASRKASVLEKVRVIECQEAVGRMGRKELMALVFKLRFGTGRFVSRKGAKAQRRKTPPLSLCAFA